VSSSTAARWRPLEPVLRRASSSARATNARVGSSSAGRGARGAQAAMATSGPQSSPRWLQWRAAEARGAAAACAPAREKGRRPYIGGRALGRGSQPAPTQWAMAWAVGAAATCARTAANGRRRRTGRRVETHHVEQRPLPHLASRTGHPALRSVHRTRAGLGAHYCEVRLQPTWPGMTRRSRLDLNFDLTLFDQLKLKILLQKWTK
jgi:hypothetical protein